MADPRTNWEQVGERLEELGLKLKLHFEQASDEDRPAVEDDIRRALRSVGDAVEQVFTAVGIAARDEGVRDDARDVGRSLVDALDTTFSELGERFRSAVKRDD